MTHTPSPHGRRPSTRAELIAWHTAATLTGAGWPDTALLLEICDAQPEDALKPASLAEGLDIELLDVATAPDVWHLAWGRPVSPRASGVILAWTDTADPPGDRTTHHVAVRTRDGDTATITQPPGGQPALTHDADTHPGIAALLGPLLRR